MEYFFLNKKLLKDFKIKEIFVLGSLLYFLLAINLLNKTSDRNFQTTNVSAAPVCRPFCQTEPACCAQIIKRMNELGGPNAILDLPDSEQPYHMCEWTEWNPDTNERAYCRPATCDQLPAGIQYRGRCGHYWKFQAGATDSPDGYGCMIGSSPETMRPICGGGGKTPTNTPPPGTTNTPAPNKSPTKPPGGQAGSLTVKVHIDSKTGSLYSDTNAVANPYSSNKSLLVYITGPTSSGHQFGEQLYVPGINKNSCSSKTGFPYQCTSGSVIWKGSDGKSGTSPGAYSARILQIPPGWEKISGADSASGILSSGGGLTLDLAIRQVGGTTGTPSPSPTTNPNATNTPIPTPDTLTCPSTSLETYESWGLNPPDPNAESNPEIVLRMRGWESTNAELALVTYGFPPGEPPDPKAPQLNSVLQNGAVFSAAYQVHKWDYSQNKPSPELENAFPVSLLGLRATAGQTVRAPENGYAIGAGYQNMLIYADQDSVTLNITGDDSAIEGYALHLEGFCVDPNLLTLYKQLHSEGRRKMPVLRGGQKIGITKEGEVKVAVRDSGSWMDPRSRLDWWKNIEKAVVYGDTNEDGVVDTIDYLYYIRAVTGGSLPNGVNPDVNSDGDISLIDREIIVNILRRQRINPIEFGI